MDQQKGLWANRFDKLRELVASVADFSSSSEARVVEYTQFLDACVHALDGLKSIKPVKKVDEHEDTHDRACPPEFLCPLSRNIMVDPVVVSSGQTYDRKAIEEWLEKNSTCPKTKVELDGSIIVSNVLVREMIMVWTSKSGDEFHGQHKFFSNDELTELERINLDILLEKVSSVTSPDRRMAARRLRALTLYSRSHRLYFGESPEAVSSLVHALLLQKNNPEDEVEEDLLYTISHTALHEGPRVVLGNTQMLISLVVGGIRPERSEGIRIRAASILRMLSYVEANQKLMGEDGAVKALMGVLERGDTVIWGEAVNCLCQLCESGRNIQRFVAEGGLEILFEKISKRESVMDLVYLLERVTTNEMAVVMWAHNDGIRLLTSLLTDAASCWGTKEGCLGCLHNMCPYFRHDMEGEDVIGAISLCVVAENPRPAVEKKARELLHKINQRI